MYSICTFHAIADAKNIFDYPFFLMDNQKVVRRKRLKELMKHLNVNNIQFAEGVGTSAPFVSQLLNGHRSITIAFAYKISKRYTRFNPAWLITGEGQMFNESETVDFSRVQPGILTGVMEPDATYERVAAAGLLESIFHRVAMLEQVVQEMQEDMEEMEKRLSKVEQCKKQ